MSQPTQAEISAWKSKAEKWDELEKKIGKCYYDEEGNEVTDDNIDLATIGEIAASAFGWL